MAFKLIVQNSKIVLKSVANYIINASGIKDLLTGTSNVDTNGKIDWTLQHYADTAANFTSANPTLLVGQIGIETDNLLTTPKFKIGDGANDWNTLPYANSTSGGTWGSITGTLSNQTDLQTALNAKEDTANKSTNLNTDQASNTKYPSVKAVYDWATGLFVKKGTLTTNYIQKATSTDTIGNSTITDDGTTVTIGNVIDVNLTLDAYNTNGVGSGGANLVLKNNTLKRAEITTNNATGLVNFKTYNGYWLLLSNGSTESIGLGQGGNYITFNMNGITKMQLDTSGNLKLTNLTASQIVGTDASKNLVSIAFGTTAGTVLEGDRITQTITNGVTDKAPSEDAVFDALALKLTAANNLSDLANPLTARNNLKIWDLRITTGNQSTTSNVATNITDLVSPTLTANKLYDFEGHIYASCNNTGGVKFQITIPTGATITACFDGSIGTNATFQSSIVLASATLTGFSFIQFNGGNIIKVKGQVSLGVTAGTIQFGFASGTNTQTSTINQLGTHITLRQLD